MKLQLEEKSAEIDQLKTEITQIKEDHLCEIEKLTNAKEETSDRFANSAEIEAFEKKNDELNFEIASLHEKMHLLSRQNETLKNTISTKDKEKVGLNKSINALNRKVAELQKSIDSAHEQIRLNQSE